MRPGGISCEGAQGLLVSTAFGTVRQGGATARPRPGAPVADQEPPRGDAGVSLSGAGGRFAGLLHSPGADRGCGGPPIRAQPPAAHSAIHGTSADDSPIPRPFWRRPGSLLHLGEREGKGIRDRRPCIPGTYRPRRDIRMPGGFPDDPDQPDGGSWIRRAVCPQSIQLRIGGSTSICQRRALISPRC